MHLVWLYMCRPLYFRKRRTTCFLLLPTLSCQPVCTKIKVGLTLRRPIVKIPERKSLASRVTSWVTPKPPSAATQEIPLRHPVHPAATGWCRLRTAAVGCPLWNLPFLPQVHLPSSHVRLYHHRLQFNSKDKTNMWKTSTPMWCWNRKTASRNESKTCLDLKDDLKDDYLLLTKKSVKKWGIQ
jgi:hypothetical protein